MPTTTPLRGQTVRQPSSAWLLLADASTVSGGRTPVCNDKSKVLRYSLLRQLTSNFLAPGGLYEDHCHCHCARAARRGFSLGPKSRYGLVQAGHARDGDRQSPSCRFDEKPSGAAVLRSGTAFHLRLQSRRSGTLISESR